ncbi:MAG: flagellar export chaperone FlgN [Alcanivorax sp.]|jgi:flagella synthesis protein FlgN
MSLDTENFTRLLSSELDTSRELHNLLQQEVVALNDNQPSELERLNPLKQTAVANLRAAAGRRLQWMTDNNLLHSPKSIEHPDLQQTPIALELWQALAAQYETTRQLSASLNEMVLAMRFRTQQKLKILHAQHNDPHLYNENGRAANALRGKQSIEA